jgi:hypothetical protein
MTPLRAAIDECLAIEDTEAAPRLPIDTVARWVRSEHLLWLWALMGGPANWGIDWSTWGLPIPEDPAGRDWDGPGAGSGKRWRDHKAGGLSIAHLDSGSLVDAYRALGWPDGPRAYLEATDYNSILRGPHRDAWLRWAAKVVHDPAALEWIAEHWRDEYWAPAWRTYLGEYLAGRITWLEALAAATANARVSNSVKGVGKRLRGGYGDREPAGAEETLAEYVAYKAGARGESGRERAERQVGYVRRVAVVVEAVTSSPVD